MLMSTMYMYDNDIFMKMYKIDLRDLCIYIFILVQQYLQSLIARYSMFIE